ncbi:glycosyltransferase [Deinococcus sp. JMULE3]|nr:glycosyltransferase [Deinococcus sp. JMULE3]
MCNSEFLARMDADDIMHPERLERQIKYLTLYPNTDVVGSSAIIIDTQNDPVNHRSATAASNALDAARSGSFIHPTILARASWFKNNPYSEDILRAEDYDLWLRTADYSIFRNISEPLLYYREIGISHKINT